MTTVTLRHVLRINDDKPIVGHLPHELFVACALHFPDLLYLHPNKSLARFILMPNGLIILIIIFGHLRALVCLAPELKLASPKKEKSNLMLTGII